ncbi:aminotransferase class IV [Rubrivirga sp.]|uniref:aminotransferase class IV n=1 Tax=Rubrivirga sp. TaxID=1885344 RepID=UPI003B52A33D
MSAPHLLETMRAEGRAVALLDRHLARLASSAEALGYALDAEAVRQRVEAEARAADGVRGVRLTVGSAGDAEVASWALGDVPFRTAWIDPEPFPDAGTWRCVHKTTARDPYRLRHERARQRGADEAILVNGRGEITEGTRTNVWAEIGGRLWTPPLAAGGLAGVFRAHVLATDPLAGERVLTPADLRAADAVFLSNALRGWMPVALAG